MKALGQLFAAFFKISLFVIGGGYAIIAVADSVLPRRGWVKEGELIDHLPVFQMLPGLIATHTAVYVGRKVAGLVGAVVAVVAIALPAVGVFTAVSLFYASLPLGNPFLAGAFTGLRASLTGIIAATIVRSWRRSDRTPLFYLLFLSALVALGPLALPIPLVLLATIVLGLLDEFRPRGRLNASLLPLLLFAKYGLLGFGGGFVLVPMYLVDFVGPAAPYLQIAAEDFSNVMALSQMTPGPVGVNCATFFGHALAGVPGAIAASILLLLPGSVLAYLAFRSLDAFRTSRIVRGIMTGIRPASLALMGVALVAFAHTTFTGSAAVVLAIACFVLQLHTKINVMYLILLSALAGLVATTLGII